MFADREPYVYLARYPLAFRDSIDDGLRPPVLDIHRPQGHHDTITANNQPGQLASPQTIIPIMDSITHLTNKILIDRARQGLPQQPQQDQIPSTAPPPYTASEDNDNSDSDSEDEDEDPSPLSLTINAATSIQGNNNLVPTSASPLADATKFSALLLHAVKRINDSASSGDGGKGRGRVNVALTINCGVTVVGDRNVVGSVGLRAKQGSATGGAVEGSGLKRKAASEVS